MQNNVSVMFIIMFYAIRVYQEICDGCSRNCSKVVGDGRTSVFSRQMGTRVLDVEVDRHIIIYDIEISYIFGLHILENMENP